MKYATSVKFGGELINAFDCDYDDYKELQLLCPECKEPVYLQKESLRFLKKNLKETRIPAHFKHFSIRDLAHLITCESRVSKYDQKEIDRRKIQARNQRLKTLHSYFWKLFLNNCECLGLGAGMLSPDAMQIKIQEFLQPQRGIVFGSSFGFNGQKEADKFYNTHIQDATLNVERSIFKDCLFDDIRDYFLKPSHTVWVQHKQERNRTINTILTENILEEITLFLSAKSSNKLREYCISFGIIRSVSSTSEVSNWFKQCLIVNKVPLWRVGISGFAMELIKIDWANVLNSSKFM
jgi:hypothetical protein